MEYVIIIDVGTGGLHVSLMDAEGRVIASQYKEIVYASGDSPHALTFDPDDEFENALHLIEYVLEQSSIDRNKVLAVTVTSQRHGGVFLDADHHPVYACPNIDDMAGQEALSLSRSEAQRVYELTTRWPTGLFHAVRLRWLKRHKPNIFENMTTFLMINDWFVFKLSGVICSEWTNAAETLLFDITQRAWSDELVKFFEVESLELPRIVEPGTIVGTLQSDLVKRLGLRQELTIVLAASDTQSALLGTGALKNGDVTVVNGSTTPIQMVVERLLIDERCRIWTGPYLVGSPG